MAFRGRVAVCFENHTKNQITKCVKMVELFYDKPVGNKVTDSL